jgi:tyrosine-protein kinase Etk/Wzc
LEQLESAARKYDSSLRRLPKTSTALSQYQRNKEALQQLYSLVNEKYQESMINELSQSGSALIINPAIIPDTPEKPNRKLIILFGLILGPIVSFGYILIRDHFDDTVKTPDDIEKKGIKFLSWVPHLDLNGNSLYGNNEIVSLYEQDIHIGESFRTIKARIQHGKVESEIPLMILVTSSAESEGKTFVSINLADSFAQSNKRTLIIDCDLRRPRIQTVFGVDKTPGLTDYLHHKVKLVDIVRRSKVNNLSFITSGTIPSNPAEILESKLMKNFLQEVKGVFDVILLDSPPMVAVIDAEILSKLVDGTILVISADKTENRLMTDAIDLIKRNNAPFFGTVLNNFKYKSGYGYYYKYYYNYSSSSSHKGKKNYKLRA